MLAELIIERRKRLNLSQPELARRSGISRARIGDLERGKGLLGLERTEGLASALGVQQRQLIELVMQGWLDDAEIEYKVKVRGKKVRPVNTGEALKKLRLDSGVSLRAMARALEVSAPRVVELERGRKLITPLTAWYYADALGVDHKPWVRTALQDAAHRKCGAGFEVRVS
jgi:transcriptional regulator with XRE-family HTH domain